MPAVSHRKPQPASPTTTATLRLALVNNMPLAARAETARDLLALVPAMTHGVPVEVSEHDLDSTELDLLVADPPDLLIVTGSEPRADRLEEEAYWPDLERLLRWAPTATRSVLLSCLAAHAYLLAMDGIERVPLPRKCHGAFPNAVHPGHPLTAGLPPSVRVPHSRSNDVPTRAVAAAGWEVHLEGPSVGWTVASRVDAGCRVVLAQGHPEYGTGALLREHRRDARRYVAGERPDFPPVPAHYLGPTGEEALAGYQAAVEESRLTTTAYPFEAALASIENDWQFPGRQLIGNWVAETGRRSAQSIGR